MEPFIIKGVACKYPRIDQPYHFGKVENRSVPCKVDDENAAYELTVLLSSEKMTELWGLMEKAWAEGKETDWPAKIQPDFDKVEGLYEVKTRRKAAYGKVIQRYADNAAVPDDFKLTGGSIVNCAVQFVPYKMREHGVALRLVGVQVLKYVPYVGKSPFEPTDGYTGIDDGFDDPFSEFDAPSVEPPNSVSF